VVGGILVYQKFENVIDEVEYVNKNIICIMIETNTGRIYFISIYAPDINKSKEREIFFEDTINKLSNNEKIFIMDDFNSRIGNIPIPNIM
jgi:hypothetical protein